MATVQNLINRAYRRIGALSPGESPDADESSDALEALNDLLASWSVQSLFVYQILEEVFTLTGAQSYTIGSGGDFDTTRPTQIATAFVRFSGSDYPVTVTRDKAEYDRIHEKTTSSQPYVLYYQPSYPLGTIYVWPVGDASYELHINSMKQLETFFALTDTVSLPPGYELALTLSLGRVLALENGRPLSQDFIRQQGEAVASIKRINRQIPIVHFDPALPGMGGGYNIESDC